MKTIKLRLGVNIDHVATLRQVRGTDYPDLVQAARVCEVAGATGITVHLREDRRHIQDRDVFALRKAIKTRLNLEMANNPDILAVALKVKPDEVCLVPERRQELTTEGGLDAAGQARRLRPTIQKLSDAGIEVSLFIAPDPRQIEAAAALGAPVIELHTGTYCDHTGSAARKELKALCEGARLAHKLGLIVNAGHGINTANARGILDIPYLNTLNIGHSIICQAVFVGLNRAVKEMLEAMKPYGGGQTS
ncbi:MAG: pyridoxine 5'-phosphate synthase [bacterium]|jgi:pyridoxine 5-phosphate synthase